MKLTPKNLPKISAKQFSQRVAQMPYENAEMIATAEKLLITSGKLISPFKPGENVILLLSGGLDSVVVWGLLLAVYKVNVYPLTVMSQHPGQKRAIEYFSKYYQHKYPKNFIKPFAVKGNITAPQFEYLNFNLSDFSPEEILSMYEPLMHGVMPKGISGSNTLFAFNAMHYSVYLKMMHQIEVNKIIGAVTAEDGKTMPPQTLTSIRLTNVLLRQFTQNNQLDFLSLAFEPRYGFFWEKSELVKLGKKLKLPLERTSSCLEKQTLHCGVCTSCQHRKYGFQQAKIKDKTVYENDLGFLERLGHELTSLYDHTRLKLSQI